MAAAIHPLNAESDRLLFAYWVPNVSGGLVISKIPQNTNWDLESNIRYAKAAEDAGFEYGLTQMRFLASYGAAKQHESVTFSQAILGATKSIKIIAALLPGIWDPTVAAKQIASIENYSNGRVAVNVVSGWFKGEFTALGQWWLDHAERYRRSNEFIRVLKGIWTSNDETGFSFSGDFYKYNNYNLSPKPVQSPHPEIFQGGNSDDARNNAAEVSDWYFMNGNDLDGFREQIEDVKARAAKTGHTVRFAVNGFVIVRETEEEAISVLQAIQGKADKEAVVQFQEAVKQAGASTSNKTGMWANSKFEDLVQYNDGFKTKLIGTKEQVAERIVLLKSLGIDLVLTAFLHYDQEIKQFGDEVIPLVRQYEKDGRGRDVDYEIEQTGDVYRKR
ncbi:methanesulfonate monooxygenase [Emericellopsis atlantica]|uniref:Methanesulfonate monooxygenase n=1 Tax=Emericellopsis atlantica TaxID=2614577 RepID=A0A9P7ZTP5_9HYPO|nr:methanesulfonate monooxygenase [Emericellopsis atlantica]KAG9258129.1 methanesulfonate monooxygenase [Emericellopsis atlantica]